MSAHCVLIGAGHAAAQLCASLRGQKWDGPITLIGDESFLPYHRPPLSKTQLDPEGDGAVQLIRPADFYAANDIEVITGVRVQTLDRERRIIHAGSREIAYDKCVLSLGSTHRKPPIPGITGKGVFNLRTAEDCATLRGLVRAGSRAVIIGGGFIGLEAAASLRKLGLDVTVLEMAPRVLSRVTSPDVSAYFERLHTAHGVRVCCDMTVTAIEEVGDALRVQTSGEHTFPADLIVLGAGAAPACALAESCGLAVDNGIAVNENNQTSDPDIFAIGDCCNQFNPFYGRRLRLESVQNAIEQAKIAATALTGGQASHYAIPWFWSDQYDVKFQITGVSDGYEQVVLRGDAEQSRSFSAWYFGGGRLLAVDAVNDSMSYAVAMKLLKSGLTPDPAQVGDASIEVKQLLKNAKENS